MFDFTPTIQGVDGVTYTLGAVANAGSNFRPVWKKAHTIINRGVRKQFSTQGGYLGKKWPRLNRKYARWKRRKYGQKTIERRTDNMWQGLVNPNHDDHVFRSLPQHMEVGTLNPIAMIQHRGAPVNNLPARPLVGLTEDEIMPILKLMQEHLVKRERAGFRRIRA